MQLCPSCGRETPGGFPRCANCGAELPATPLRQERKLVTVLFCDLVGFTSRAETMDPEDVRALLAPYHEHVRGELERFGGTVEKFIGDAVMAVFGAPVAHEDDPERAVRAALAIRDWAAEQGIELRIGVNTGEALVTIGGEPLATGDVVNTAARLQSGAPTGGVLVGRTTRRAARDAIEFREHDAIDAKGKAEPVEAWEALNSRSLVTVEREARAPLVGRERELALLLESFRRAGEDREPQLVTLIGVPGIGKSRLVFELFKLLEAREEVVYWRRGRSLPYGDGVTYWALGEILKAELGILESDTVDEAAAKLHAAVEALVPESIDAAWVERHLRPLVGLGADPDRGTGEESRTAWRRFFEALAERGPLVLVFEDLHWADDRLLDFVDELVEWASGVPLLVVGTARTELLTRRPGWGGGKPNALTISLTALTDADTARLVGHLLGQSVVAAETQSELLAHAGGNPLFAEEFARLVEERGGAGPLDVPQSVHGLIAARIDALPTEDKGLLQDAAVLGRSFWVGALAALGGADGDEVERRLHALERREFVRRERRSTVSAEGEYVFRHALVRDAAYAQIPRGVRAEKHRRAGEWIETLSPDRAEDRAEMLAHHYSSALEYARASGLATEGAEQATRRAFVEAGDRALALFAFGAAARFYSDALALWPPAESPSPELLLRIAKAFHAAGDERAPQFLADAREASLRAGDRASAAVAEALLMHLTWLRRDASASRAHRTRALELIRAERPSAAKALVLARAASSHGVAGEPEPAIAIGREALAIAEALVLPDLVAHALTTIGGARQTLGDPGGIADLERAVRTALAANSPEALRAYNNLAAALRDAGDVTRSRMTVEEGIASAERFGGGPMLLFLRQVKTVEDYFAGEWDEAVARLDEFIAQAEASPHYQEGGLRAIRALIRSSRSDLEGATADVDSGLAAARTAGDPQAIGPAVSIAVRTYVMAGDRRRATNVLLELIDFIRTHPQEAIFASNVGFVVVELGVERELVELLGPAQDGESPWVTAARAMAQGRFLEAADTYASMPVLPFEAEARLRAAEQLLTEGRRAEADEQLRLASAFWRSVGATWFLREADQLLAATA